VQQNENLFTAADSAQLLAVLTRIFARLIAKSAIESIQIGRVRPSGLDRFITNQQLALLCRGNHTWQLCALAY
jgi:hypothetical protein